MAHHGSSSLIASIGTALTAFSYPQSPIRVTSSPLRNDPTLMAFENDVAQRLEELTKSTHDGFYLNLPWLHQALGATLATNSAVEALIPDFDLPYSERDDKWVGEYLDDSAKLLDVCNGLKDRISDIKHYHSKLQLALHRVDAATHNSGNEASCQRARNALHDCLATDEGQRQRHGLAKLQSCGSSLRRMADKLAAPSLKSKPFVTAIYAAKFNTIFTCGLLEAALTLKPRRSVCSLHVPSNFAWSVSLTTLQHRLKEELHRGRTTSGSRLSELASVIDIVIQLHNILDDGLAQPNMKMLPLNKKQADDLRRLAESLKKQTKDLGKGLEHLQQQVNELFRMLVKSRMALLDLISHSRS